MNNVDCVGCHQLGQEATRTIPAQFGKFKSGEEAWMRRISSGQSGEMMTNRIAGQFGGAPYKYFGDWTDRVAKGELPKNKPPRPSGVERNLVVTTWDWSTPDKYMHDLISSDRRNPTVNANGLLYGSPEYSTDNSPILDPKTNTVSFFKMPVADPAMPVSLGPGHAGAVEADGAVGLLGRSQSCGTPAPTTTTRCSARTAASGSPPPCAAWTIRPGARRARTTSTPRCSRSTRARVRPRCSISKTKEYEFIDTCFGTHHPQFGYDADNTLWMSGTGPVAGWINTKVWDETHDAQKATGWFPFVLDTNGNGKLDEFTEPGKPEDGQGHAHQRRLRPLCGDAESERRLDLVHLRHVRRHGRASCASIRRPSSASSIALPKEAIGVRGGDIDTNGVLWGSGSAGHLIAFDRSKCKGPLNGPNATGNPLPGGLHAHQVSRPGLRRAAELAAPRRATTPGSISTTPSGSATTCRSRPPTCRTASSPWSSGKMVLMRVPYPMGYYAKGLDARIDDPNAGWKGRGLWSATGDRTPWLNERGKGALSDGRAHPGAARSAGALRRSAIATDSEGRSESCALRTRGIGR